MINPKSIQRKKSQQHISIKQGQQISLKRKKSTSNVISSTKIKKQIEKQQKDNVNGGVKKDKQQKKLGHSLSKGKLKNHKSTGKFNGISNNDENFNNMNLGGDTLVHKKSVQKLHTIKISKLVTHGEEKKQQKQKNIKTIHTQNTLNKVSSQLKLLNKKKKKESKQYPLITNGTDRLYNKKGDNLSNFNSNGQNQVSQNCSKTLLPNKKSSLLVKNPSSTNIKKSTIVSTNKTTHKSKKSSSTLHPNKSTTTNHRTSNNNKIKANAKRISEIIQKSILYSDVNYDFKEQISLLGSSKKSEEFVVPYPFQSTQSEEIVHFRVEDKAKWEEENRAAIIIQKNFRGYIQRKYIQEARYIIDSIKRIQRVWRGYIVRKRLRSQNLKNSKLNNQNHPTQQKPQQKCLVEKTQELKLTSRQNQSKYQSVPFQQNPKSQDLKDIISNLLKQDGLNQALKQKIRKAMLLQQQQKLNVQTTSAIKNSQQHQNLIQPIPTNKHNKQKSLSQLSINVNINYEELNEINEQQNSSIYEIQPSNLKKSQKQSQKQSQPQKNKQFYVQKKINMEINSQRYFNSPMNGPLVSPGIKNIMMSPAGIKKVSSPKCLSSSFSKDVKNSYNNYFKSAKAGNAAFMSPRKITNDEGYLKGETKDKFNNKATQQKQNESTHINKSNSTKKQNPWQQQFNFNKDYFKLNEELRIMKKEDYLQIDDNSLNNNKYQNYSINQSSPIISCNIQLENNQLFTKICQQSDINLLETQKLQNLNDIGILEQQQQTRRTPKTFVKPIKPFPTNFAFIEEFCLRITDYLRDQQQQMLQIFIQKIKGMKYYKLQKIFKQWQRLEFQQYSHDNQQLQNMVIKQGYQYPIIFSRMQKKMIMEYLPLREYLEENGYDEVEIVTEKSPQFAYLQFIFDVFEESMYEHFRGYNVRNINLAKREEENTSEFNYLNIILSQAMGNILKCSQMLCGSFQTQQMNQIEKQQRYLINEQRMQQMTNEYVKFDENSCQMWILMLISKEIFEELVGEVVLINRGLGVMEG